MKITVPKHLYDDWGRAWPGTTVCKLALIDERQKALLLTICGKPEAFITHKALVDPMQYARTTGGAKVHFDSGATWLRAGLFYAELRCSPMFRREIWEMLWRETLGKIDAPQLAQPTKPVDPFWQDEPRDYGAARPQDRWFG